MRSEKRLEAILAAAAEIFSEQGYAAATLTRIAQRAGTSIGSLYQYFEDKPALADELGRRYGAEIATLWSDWAGGADAAPSDAIAGEIADLVIDFHRAHPAYLVLLSEYQAYRHDDGDRDRLRLCIAAFLSARLSPPDHGRARLIAEMVILSAKNFGRIAGNGPAPDMTAEFRLMLASYLHAVLVPRDASA